MSRSDSQDGSPKPSRRPRGRPYKNVPDVRSVSMLGIGMVAGAVLGAAIALLVAPQAGVETRRAIGRRAANMRGGSGVWSRLGRELKRAAASRKTEADIEARRHRPVESPEPGVPLAGSV